MQAALNDGKGGQRTDISASVAAREILDVQQQIIASSVKTAKMSISVVIRTSNQSSRMAARNRIAGDGSTDTESNARHRAHEWRTWILREPCTA